MLDDNTLLRKEFNISCERDLDEFWFFFERKLVCFEEMTLIYHLVSEILYRFESSALNIMNLPRIEVYKKIERKELSVKVVFIEKKSGELIFESENHIFISKLKKHLTKLDIVPDVDFFDKSVIIRGKSSGVPDSRFLSFIRDDNPKLKESPRDRKSCEHCGFIDFSTQTELEEEVLDIHSKIDSKSYVKIINDKEGESAKIVDDMLESIKTMQDIVESFEYKLEASMLAMFSRELHTFSSDLATFFEFEDMSIALKSVAKTVEEINLQNVCHKRVKMLISGISEDLRSWVDAIFVNQNSIDIHYLDKSLLSSAQGFKDYIYAS